MRRYTASGLLEQERFSMTVLFLLFACTGKDEPAKPDDSETEDTGEPAVPTPAVPEFGLGDPVLTVVGTTDDGLDVVRDLAFQPDAPQRLWTVNQATDGTVIYEAPGTKEQTSEERIDRYAEHFMDEVSSIAFGAPGFFATCQESQNTYDHTHEPNEFMGPALWPSDLEIYTEVGQTWALLGSHLDMLHESPDCMGIAWDHDNVYWVFDGYNGDFVRYDFQIDHGPGEDDHSDGIIRRYDVELTRVPNVPGHVVMDPDTGFFYVADTGTGRVLRVDPSTAEFEDDLRQVLEPLEEYSQYTGTTTDDFASGLGEPSGIELGDGRLFVSDHASGEIIAYALGTGEELGRIATGAEGLMGLALDADGTLWYVDAEANQVVRIDPQVVKAETKDR
jgi:hypothetical protein